MIDKKFQSPIPFFFLPHYKHDVFFGIFLKIEMALQCNEYALSIDSKNQQFFCLVIRSVSCAPKRFHNQKHD